MIRRSFLALLAPTLLSFWPARGAVAPPPPNFDRDIAPLLVRRCLDCHSGSSPKGSLDLSRARSAREVLAGLKLEDIPFWQRIRDDEMPPKKPLSASEKALLKQWLLAGARWGTDPVDPFRVTTEHRAGYDWWSLQPLQSVPPPQTANLSWSRNPIDRFLLVKLHERGLTPSPEADRRTLIRRLTFDLTGLPPTPAEVQAFVQDLRPDAYQRLVDRLLASPAYGERYARLWLDLVRFGESDGFERDLPRFQAWPYRDWVIQAFNTDLPYDEFTRWQLAGDVLAPDRPDGLPPTGFLVAGAHDIVLPVSETMKAAMRQDELEDLVGTVGQTFLGLTVHCARCHDHKFDPVPQADYYRLVASLAGVRHGERSFSSESMQITLARLRQDADKWTHSLQTLEQPVRQQLLQEKRKQLLVGPQPLACWDFTRGLSDQLGNLHARLHGKARLSSEGLVLEGRTAYASTGPLQQDLTEKTFQVWVKLEDLEQRGGGVLSIQSLDGHVFDALVFAEQQPGRWIAGSDFFRRTKPVEGPPEKVTKQIVHLAITYSQHGQITLYRQGVPYGRSYRVDTPVSFLSGKAQVLFGLRHGEPTGNRLFRGTIVRAQLHDRALSPDEIRRSVGLPTIRPEEILARLNDSQRQEHARLTSARAALLRDIERLQRQVARRIYAVNSQPIGKTHVLHRGEVTAPGEIVQPGVVSALRRHLHPSDHTPPTDEAKRRLHLAQWISSPQNPLFARVLVNRLWQYHFGVGIVDTPSDLGFNGGRPSHPELLDWLARELIRQRYSLKAIHRLIVTSAAYRQSSHPRPGPSQIDADNRLLWRKSPTRLEAEAVRDAILAVTGDLDRTMGGPPYLDFRTYFFKGTQFYDALDQVGPAFQRRSIYRMWARGGRSPFLDTFDCPDPSATTPRRAVTTTPLQALTLFNNAFVLHQADRFAQRVRREAGADLDAQLRHAYRLAFTRDPDDREFPLLRAFLARHDLEALARILFNTNEFVQVE